MAVPQKKAVILPLSEERRRFQRVRVSLLGRYLLADPREDFLEESVTDRETPRPPAEAYRLLIQPPLPSYVASLAP